MTGVNLSRWTMSYFAAALLALVVGEVLMLAGYGFPAAPLRAPQTLVLVHLIAIGWLSLLLCGALFQFVPVLVARNLYSDMLPLPTLVLLVTGLGLLLCGFLQLAGTQQRVESAGISRLVLPDAEQLAGHIEREPAHAIFHEANKSHFRTPLP